MQHHKPARQYDHLHQQGRVQQWRCRAGRHLCQLDANSSRCIIGLPPENQPMQPMQPMQQMQMACLLQQWQGAESVDNSKGKRGAATTQQQASLPTHSMALMPLHARTNLQHQCSSA